MNSLPTSPPASTAAATIPAAYLADYLKAGAQYGIPWTVLAGIGEIESGQGRSDAPGSVRTWRLEVAPPSGGLV